MRVPLFDLNIAHAKSWNDALEKGRPTANLEYVKLINLTDGSWKPDFEELKKIDNSKDQFIVFTDKFFTHAKYFPPKIKKIAWTMEPRKYDPAAYEELEKEIESFDLILTWDKHLLKKHQDKCQFIPPDGVFVENYSVFINKKPKSKLVSHVYSDKKILEGHRLRHEIASRIEGNKNVDFWGSGSSQPMEKKSESLNDYMFSIAIENNRDENYFTDKILDCFATKTIPIYWGAPNIGKWFNLDGIITFENTDHLCSILENLSFDDYWSKQSAVIENYKKSLEYYDYDNFIFRAIRK